MRTIESRIDTGGARFTENAAAYQDLVATLRERQRAEAGAMSVPELFAHLLLVAEQLSQRLQQMQSGAARSWSPRTRCTARRSWRRCSRPCCTSI